MLRTLLSALSLLVAAIALLVYMPVSFVSYTLTDTDAFVTRVDAVWDEPAVRSWIAVTATDALVESGILDQAVDAVLPAELRLVRGAALLGARSLVTEAIAAGIESEFAANAVHRTAETLQPLVRDGITSARGVLEVRNGVLYADLATPAQDLVVRLGGPDLAQTLARTGVFEPLEAVVVTEDPNAPTWLLLFDFAINASRILGLVTLAAFFLGLLFAPGRRRAVVAIGAILAGAGLLWFVVLMSLGSTTSPQLGEQALAAAIRAATQPLLSDSVLAMVVGVLFMLVAGAYAWWQPWVTQRAADVQLRLMARQEGLDRGGDL